MLAVDIDNSYVEGAKYVTLMSLVQSKRWSSPANGVKSFIPAIGIADDYNPRHSMEVKTAGGTVDFLPLAGHPTSDYWWVSVTDGEGNWAHGEVTDLATPTALVLDTSGLNNQKEWATTLRARNTGDTQDAVVLWPITNVESNPTVTIPAGYGN